ncbi:MAG TPA: acyl-ACP--UDP-N-acetylglucosamine O-acyltransferase [Gammaproteobacteria bacterium]|nr:acyl-ACP--UDP-N-acetylglucosamine O-acyltransferase [Gammaproteobacteria bacterium]
MSLHPSAVVSSAARIDPSAEIGPFCIIEGEVTIGPRTIVESHARIGHRFGTVEIGADNFIQHGAVLGGPPQDVSYKGGATALIIGDRNRIGEYVSVNQGTEKGGGVTRIGNDVMLMAFVHLGHDCQIADHVIVTNATQIAGHCRLDDHALLSGLTGLTQFTRLGRYSFLTGGSTANKDIPPFTIAEGRWARPRAVNRVALARAGFSTDERRNIQKATRIVLDSSRTIAQVCEQIREQCEPGAQIDYIVEFLETSDRGIARR